MDKQEKILDRVSKKTHVSKQDILSLANDLQSKDLNKDEDIKNFIYKISKVAQKELNNEQVNKLVSLIKNNQVPQDIDRLL